MKKLKLDLKDLRVESFETSMVTSSRGTVKGQATYDCDTPVVPCETDIECPTDHGSCIATCHQTCPQTCPISCLYTACGDTCNDKIETCHPECP